MTRICRPDNTGLEKLTGPSVFLAGGITNCRDWQKEAIGMLGKDFKVILNPRRPYDIEPDSDEAKQQIRWEYYHLQKAGLILFWFEEGIYGGAIQPIALYELGRHGANSYVDAVVGTHREYARRFDVVEQLGLARPDLVVHDSLEAACEQAARWAYKKRVHKK